MQESNHILKVPRKTVIDEWELPYCGNPDEGVVIISDKMVDTTRWDVVHELIVKIKDRYYQTHYTVGATEYQEHEIWEYEDPITFYEVIAVQKVIQVFELAKSEPVSATKSNEVIGLDEL